MTNNMNAGIQVPLMVMIAMMVPIAIALTYWPVTLVVLTVWGISKASSRGRR